MSFLVHGDASVIVYGRVYCGGQTESVILRSKLQTAKCKIRLYNRVVCEKGYRLGVFDFGQRRLVSEERTIDVF